MSGRAGAGSRSSARLPDRIHIVGASGSGTTTLGAALGARFGHRHLDTDDFFWIRTDPPFREQRPREERLALLWRALQESTAWVLSGSLCGWGDPVIREFELVVFLVVPTPVRMARLRAREIARYGERAIAPGGSLQAPRSRSSSGPRATTRATSRCEAARCTRRGWRPCRARW